MVAASSPAIRGARVSSGAVRQAGLNLMKKMSMPFLFCMFSPFKKCSFLVKKILLIKQCIDSFLFFFHEFFPFF